MCGWYWYLMVGWVDLYVKFWLGNLLTPIDKLVLIRPLW